MKANLEQDYNKQKYIQELYRRQINRVEYKSLSELERKVFEIHYQESLNGLQFLSFITTHTIAKKLSLTPKPVKEACANLRDQGFLIITDILDNFGRTNYGYAHQIKDLSKEYYYEGFKQKTFTKTVYISRITKGGILERNCLVESKQNRELRLAGKIFRAKGIKISPEKNKRFAEIQARLNPHFGQNYKDDFSEEISDDVSFFEGNNPTSGISRYSVGAVLSVSPAAAPKDKLVTEAKYYRVSVNKQNASFLPKYFESISTLPTEIIDEHGEVRELIAKNINGIDAYCYKSMSWSTEFIESQLIFNWAEQNMSKMTVGMNWSNFHQYSQDRIMYWLEANHLYVQKCKGKIPVYDEYFQVEDGKNNKQSIYRRVRNILDYSSGEFGVNLNGEYICLDFDSQASYDLFLQKFPQIGNTLTTKTNNGFHCFFLLPKSFKKYLVDKKSLFGIAVDAKMNNFVSWSKDSIYHSSIPQILPYEIYCEWLRKENLPTKTKKPTYDKNQLIIPVGFRRNECWRLLRSFKVRGCSHKEFLEYAEYLFSCCEQIDSNRFSRKEFEYTVRKAWTKANRQDFIY